MDVSLEERIAYLERILEEVNGVVVRQDAEIAVLQRRVEMLMQREAEREAEGGGGIVLGDERPPHY